jgi:hypothetical protein
MVEELSVQSANEGTQYLLNALTGSSIKRFVLTASIGVFFDRKLVSVGVTSVDILSADCLIFDETTVYDHNSTCCKVHCVAEY